MLEDLTKLHDKGFHKIESFLDEGSLNALRGVCANHHKQWCEHNQEFYQESAINSAYLTAKGLISQADRLVLYNFISSSPLMDVAEKVVDPSCCFLNTQLFFNPVNTQQKNYWHRDAQYHLTPEQQQALVKTDQKLWHFRLALFDEPGIEIVPGSHKKWDSEEELQVRLEQNGYHNYEDLSSGQSVPLNAGDLLIFSGMAIHRGLYGKDRMALDILYCNNDPEVLRFIDNRVLPEPELMAEIDNNRLYQRTIETIAKLKAD